MKYFRYFPQIGYQFQLNGDANSAFVLAITNPVVRFKIVEKLKQHIEVIYDYVVADGERPDTVALNVYGSPDHTWIVLLMNNILSLYDWPLSAAEFDRYITEKYSSVAAAQANTLYRTTDDYYVDAATYALLPGDEQGLTISAYDFELEKNEAKRRIKVIPAQFVEPLILELRKSLA